MARKQPDHATLVERARKMFDKFDKDASGWGRNPTTNVKIQQGLC